MRGVSAAVLLGLCLSGLGWAAAPAAARVAASAGLATGTRVKVEGRIDANGVLHAEELQIRDELDDDEELRGNIVAPEAGTRRFRLLGYTVVVEPGTSIGWESGGIAPFEALTPGLRVKVDGLRTSDRCFRARKIRIRKSQFEESEIVGPIESIDPLRGAALLLRVVGLEVVLDGSTDIRDPEGRVADLGRPQRRGARDDDDFIFLGRHRLGPALVSGEIRLRGKLLNNLELAARDPDRELNPEVQGTLGLLIDWDGGLGYVELSGGGEWIQEHDGDRVDSERRGELGLSQAFLRWDDLLLPGLSLSLGRQQLQEERDWFYNNKNLDVIRVQATLESLLLDASISRNLFNRDAFRSEQRKTNLIVRASYPLAHELELEGFLIERRDRSELPDSPRILGLRLSGEPGRQLKFWADLALERGRRGERQPISQALSIRPIRAHAYDLGVTWRPRWRWDPTLTLGHAFASGPDRSSSDPGGQVDSTFRQSGLHRNKDKFNGVVSFRYYGEVLDPELANLSVLTLGWGARPLAPVSLDLIYHRYRQDVPTETLFGVEIDPDPSGLDPRLGDEWDLVLGFEPSSAFELRLTAGWFRPGPAFPQQRSAASAVTVQSKFRF